MFTPPFFAKARPEPDPHWANVVLCMNMQALTTSTTFRDEKGKAVSSVGGVAQTTGASPFGGTSLANPSGAGVYVSVPDSDDLFFDTGDVTIEAWVYRNASGNYRRFYSQQTNASSPQRSILLRTSNVNRFETIFVNTATLSLTSTNIIPLNAWSFLSYSRQGNSHFIHIDGAQEATATSSISIPNAAIAATIGGYVSDNANGEYWSGYIGPVRITKGVGRYGSGSYTPPKGPFPTFGP